MDLVYTSDDGTVLEGNALVQFFDKAIEAAGKVGCDLRGILQIPQLLQESDFVNVKIESRKLPLGTWPKDRRLKTIGYFHRRQFLQAVNGIAMGLFTRVLGWQKEEVEIYLISVRQAVEDRKAHGYWRV